MYAKWNGNRSVNATTAATTWENRARRPVFISDERDLVIPFENEAREDVFYDQVARTRNGPLPNRRRLKLKRGIR